MGQSDDCGQGGLVSDLRLTAERQDALDHGLALLRRTWVDLDHARPAQPAVAPHELRLDDGLPEDGIGTTAALDLAAVVLDQSLAQSRPRFFAYVGSSGLESAVLADAMAHSHDANLAGESGAAREVELQALRWVGELIGFPVGGGAFTSGGMTSNLTALMAARTRALPGSREDGLAGTSGAVYASAESHSSVERAVEVLGLGRRALRPIPIDGKRRMDVTALRFRIEQDVADGITPIAVVATAGTTLTGSVDPIDAIADVCDEHRIWLHVDGAYGLPAAATDRARPLFAGLERADSATIDAHKWLFVPKACGVLLVRDERSLVDAFAHDASYLVQQDEAPMHPVETTLEYSRPFRPLKLWTALRAHGAGAFRQAIDRNLVLARELEVLVGRTPGMELLQPVSDLSVVPFRRIPSLGDPDEHNVRLASAMQADGRTFIACAWIDGRIYLRPCLVNFRTTSDDVLALVEVAEELGRQLDA
jgi:aromatic-L-amino-acid decarboxylase